MVTHSSILAQRIPMNRGACQATQSMRLQRAGHDRVTQCPVLTARNAVGSATVWCRAWLESILGMGCRSQQFKFDCTKKLTSKFHLFKETMCVYCDRLNYYPSYCYAWCPNPRAGREKASKTMQHAKNGKFIADSSQDSCRHQRSGAGSESPEPTLLSKFIGCA